MFIEEKKGLFIKLFVYGVNKEKTFIPKMLLKKACTIII